MKELCLKIEELEERIAPTFCVNTSGVGGLGPTDLVLTNSPSPAGFPVAPGDPGFPAAWSAHFASDVINFPTCS